MCFQGAISANAAMWPMDCSNALRSASITLPHRRAYSLSASNCLIEPRMARLSASNVFIEPRSGSLTACAILTESSMACRSASNALIGPSRGSLSAFTISIERRAACLSASNIFVGASMACLSASSIFIGPSKALSTDSAILRCSSSGLAIASRAAFRERLKSMMLRAASEIAERWTWYRDRISAAKLAMSFILGETPEMEPPLPKATSHGDRDWENRLGPPTCAGP